MAAHSVTPGAFPPRYLARLRAGILASRSFAAHTLNRDFVGTRGFSVAFRGDSTEAVLRAFPFFDEYLARVLRDDCNAFYLNPLWLTQGSRVDPHIDRSLRSYCKTVDPPRIVSVLYIDIAPGLVGGELVLRRGSKHLARIRPLTGDLVQFDGDLTHSIDCVESGGERLSLVCEQYEVSESELDRIPLFEVESRARTYA